MVIKRNLPDFDKSRYDWVVTQHGSKVGIKGKLDDYAGKRLKAGEFRIIKKLRVRPNRVDYIGVIRK